jgi:Flp pilus assembly protein TadG
MRLPHARRGQRGQALVEMALVIVLFVTLVMGVLEFGRAWMIANMITHAASDGARAAAVSDNRDVNCVIQNKSTIQDRVRNEIANVMDPASISQISVTQLQDNGIPVVRVQVIGSVPYIFNLVGTSFSIARTVTFRDEGCPSA